MRYLLPAVLGALSLMHVDGVFAQDVPACVPACANQVRGQFTQFSCTSADDAACLCANANFGYGVRDCGQSGCGATDVQIQAYLAGSFCQGQQLAFTPTEAQAPPTSAIPSTAGPAVTTTPPAVTTPVPTTAPATTSANPETTPQTSSQSTLPPTTTAPATTAPATTAPDTTASASTQTPSPSTSTASPPATTDATSSDTSRPSTTATSTVPVTSATAPSSPSSSETSAAVPQTGGSGLSRGAAVGIGVGVAGGVVAIAFAAVFLLSKNRNRAPHASFDISQPPSSGHGQGAFEKYSNDIEMVSNRYEDMVPRQQPRVMV